MQMRNHITILGFAWGLALVAIVTFVLIQPAVAGRGGFSTSHGPNFGPPNANPTGPSFGNAGGSKGNPVIHPNAKKLTVGQCVNRCLNQWPGMAEGFCGYTCGVLK